jgi:exopolyphosphatase/guanosine-5'-triphosphate,3'-diphosphate pyrophosphatase
MFPVKASIDLGTNTVRLLIAELRPNGVVPLRVERRITRLGGGFTAGTGIAPDAWERTVAALVEFAAIIEQYPLHSLVAVATSAVRDATNGPDFCRAVKDRTGISLAVIDGEQEGRITLRGVMSALGTDDTSPLTVFDVGGGSTEYIISTPGQPLFIRSLPLGVVRLTEGRGSAAAMLEKIDRELKPLFAEVADSGLLAGLSFSTLVGTAGTATSLAAMDLAMVDYDYRRVNNHILSREAIRALYQYLAPLSPSERLATPGLEQGREDLIIAGALITLRTMELFRYASLKVSDFGLLEGLILEEHPLSFA